MIPIDQQQRERALDPSTSFIVQAPAGSGKTELLTQRFLRLLAVTPQAPEEIIAITFTKKAAAEMRDRIITSLVSATQEEPSEPHKKNTWKIAKKALERDKLEQWNILSNPNRLRIMTIDALSVHINQLAPLLGELGCQPSITENAGALYREAAEALLNQAASTKSPSALKQLLLHLDNRSEYLADLLVMMLQKREQWLPHTFINPDQLEQSRHYLENGLQQLINETLNEINTTLTPDQVHQLSIIAQEASDYLRANDPENPLANLDENAIKNTSCPDHANQWKLLTKCLFTSQYQWRKSITKKLGFPAKSLQKKNLQALIPELENTSGAHALLTRIAQLPPAKYSAQQWDILESLITILPTLVAHLRVIMQAKGTIDFTEIPIAALRALGEADAPTDLAVYLDHQIHHILIDEFQDTSAIQFKLFEQLIGEWDQSQQHSIFLVGDPMQSIYRFRNAEVSLFLQAQTHGIGPLDLEFLQLTTNFRSDDSIVSWLNTTFQSIMPQQADPNVGAIPYCKAISARQDHSIGVKYYANPLQQNENSQQPLVELIQSLPDSETIAILVRSRSQLKTIIPALHQANILFNAIEIEPLHHLPEIKDCLSLTHALLHLADDIAWLSILRAPWCGLTLQQIEVIYANKKNSYFDAIASLLNSDINQHFKSRLNPIYQALNTALNQRGQQPVYALIKNCWYELLAPDCLTTPQQHLNCEKYFELLLTLEHQDGFIDRARLNKEVAKLYADAIHQNPTVQIMTIHKSKGLEFDHVILPELQKKGVNDSSQLMQWLERPNHQGDLDLLLAPISAYGESVEPIYQYLRQTEQLKLNFESTRLLYVACTRAKSSLHLFYRYQLKDHAQPDTVLIPKGSHLSLLWPVCESHWLPLIKPITGDEREQVQQSAPLKRLPTHYLMSQTNKSTIQPVKDAQIIDLELKDSNNTASLIGTIIHYELMLLSSIPEEDRPTIKRQAQWKRQLISHGIDNEPSLQEAINTIETAIKNSQSCPRGSWILSQKHNQCMSEYPISFKEDNIIRHGIIDRLIITDETVWIVDYKTGKPSHNEPELDWIQQQCHQYRSQLEEYAKAIQQLYPQAAISAALYFPLCQQRWQPLIPVVSDLTTTLISLE
jgi:ATP-dependent helicase/nuclease subunit A